MAHEAGKGDARRPENNEAFRNNFDAIFRKQHENVVKMQQLEQERMCCVKTTYESLDKDKKT